MTEMEKMKMSEETRACPMCDTFYGQIRASREFTIDLEAKLAEVEAERDVRTEMLTICRDIFIRCENAWHGGDEEPMLADDVDELRLWLTRIIAPPQSNEAIEF